MPFNQKATSEVSKATPGKAKLDLPAPAAKQEDWKLSASLSKANTKEVAEYLASNYLLALGIKGEKGFDKNNIMVTNLNGQEKDGKVFPPQSQIAYSYSSNGTAHVKNVFIRIKEDGNKLTVEYSAQPISENNGKSSGVSYSDFINLNKDFQDLTKAAKNIIKGLDDYIDIANKVVKGQEIKTTKALEDHHRKILENDTTLIKAAEVQYQEKFNEALKHLRQAIFPGVNFSKIK